MTKAAKLTACEVTKINDLDVTFRIGSDETTITIPSAQSADALLSLMKGAARASLGLARRSGP